MKMIDPWWLSYGFILIFQTIQYILIFDMRLFTFIMWLKIIRQGFCQIFYFVLNVLKLLDGIGYLCTEWRVTYNHSQASVIKSRFMLIYSHNNTCPTYTLITCYVMVYLNTTYAALFDVDETLWLSSSSTIIWGYWNLYIMTLVWILLIYLLL